MATATRAACTSWGASGSDAHADAALAVVWGKHAGEAGQRLRRRRPAPETDGSPQSRSGSARAQAGQGTAARSLARHRKARAGARPVAIRGANQARVATQGVRVGAARTVVAGRRARASRPAPLPQSRGLLQRGAEGARDDARGHARAAAGVRVWLSWKRRGTAGQGAAGARPGGPRRSAFL